MAIPTFTNYIYKSRTTEATEFLGVIGLREEAYRAEFGVYCPTLAADQSPSDPGSLGTRTNFVPDPSTTHSEAKAFVPTAEWLQLGARPSGPVRFGYAVAAGVPANAPGDPYGFSLAPDYWFISRAMADLDADGSYVIFETYSGSKGVYIGDTATPSKPIAKGWE